MGWLIALLALVLLAFLPLGVCGVYDGSGPLALLIAGPMRIRLYPSKKEKIEKEKKPKTAQAPKENNGGSLKDFLPLAKDVLDLLKDLKARNPIKRLEMKLTLAGDDPCDLSLNYGKAWAALGNVIPRLEEMFEIKKRDMAVQCDFTAEQTTLYVRVDIALSLGWFVLLATRYGLRGFKTYRTIMNKRKGGAK